MDRLSTATHPLLLGGEAKFKDFFKSNPEQAQFLKDREKDAEINAKYQIYNTLIKSSLYTTELEGKFKYEAEANKVNFAYVAGLYSTIKDKEKLKSMSVNSKKMGNIEATSFIVKEVDNLIGNK